MTQNQIAWHNAKENKRHNQMTEAELNRHQLRTEQLQAEANELQKQQIAVNQMHYERMDEINRMHYERSDMETQRSNRAREIESYRSDTAGESIKERANAIQSAMVAETSRHQRETERIQESLNASLINKNEAEVSYTSANTGYIQARTGSEMFNQTLTQEQIKNAPVQRSLWDAQATSARTQGFVNVTSGVRNVFGSAGELIRLIPLAM